MGLVRFDVERVDAGVADERISHRDDLAAIGRVGQDLLVTGHRGVETDFPVGGQGRAKRLAAPDAAVFQGEKSRSHGASISRLRREAQEIVVEFLSRDASTSRPWKKVEGRQGTAVPTQAYILLHFSGSLCSFAAKPCPLPTPPAVTTAASPDQLRPITFKPALRRTPPDRSSPVADAPRSSAPSRSRKTSRAG